MIVQRIVEWQMISQRNLNSSIMELDWISHWRHYVCFDGYNQDDLIAMATSMVKWMTGEMTTKFAEKPQQKRR